MGIFSRHVDLEFLAIKAEHEAFQDELSAQRPITAELKALVEAFRKDRGRLPSVIYVDLETEFRWIDQMSAAECLFRPFDYFRRIRVRWQMEQFSAFGPLDVPGVLVIEVDAARTRKTEIF